jgi:hypothetical protein
MTKTAYESVQSSYDIDTLREIAEHGCASSVANQHIYYSQTTKFFDEYEDEIIEYIADTYGGEINEEIWNNNPCNIISYKNDTVWCYVELVASELVEQYEDTTCQELSDESYEILTNNDAVRELVTS